MFLENLWDHFRNDCYEVVEWAKCGAGAESALPTLLWALGAAALARQLLAALFRRFLFRRVPWWELLLQHLLFVWMVIYSVHLWLVVVRLLKLLVDYSMEAVCDEGPFPAARRKYLVQQCAVWACGAAPLALFLRARPRPAPPPLMIWITTSPWQRREMGAYGYYLQRPPAPPPPAPPPAPAPPRRALSEPQLRARHPRPHDTKNKCSKSV